MDQGFHALGQAADVLFGDAMASVDDAQGGILPDGPQRVAGARAIVGEGSKVWPEYVIPTDPKYRGRAQMLAQEMAMRINMFAAGGVTNPAKRNEMGGWGIPNPIDDIVDAGKWVAPPQRQPA